jgi:hypothetical protein
MKREPRLGGYLDSLVKDDARATARVARFGPTSFPRPSEVRAVATAEPVQARDRARPHLPWAWALAAALATSLYVLWVAPGTIAVRVDPVPIGVSTTVIYVLEWWRGYGRAMPAALAAICTAGIASALWLFGLQLFTLPIAVTAVATGVTLVGYLVVAGGHRRPWRKAAH